MLAMPRSEGGKANKQNDFKVENSQGNLSTRGFTLINSLELRSKVFRGLERKICTNVFQFSKFGKLIPTDAEKRIAFDFFVILFAIELFYLQKKGQ